MNNNDKQYFSILQWITERGIVNEKSEAFDFRDRAFLLDILTDWNQNIVVTACAQVGKSVTFSIKSLFAVKHMHFNIIYTMSSDSDVNEFVNSKFNKILQANPTEFVGMQTDNVERKELNDRFIFFKGTNSKTAAISTTADLLIHDEISRSDQKAIETYKSRIKASQYKGRWMFSNPGSERDELDTQWKKSDQKEWTVACPNCADEHYLVWPDSVDFKKKCYQCRNCKDELPDHARRRGKWVAQNPASKISGYHISHLMCPWISAEEIIDDSKGDPEYFQNFVLGQAYSPEGLSVTKGTILDIWTPRNIDDGDRYIGIDVGNIKHYEIRTKQGTIKVGTFSDWEELDTIIAYWKPKKGVIDAMPDNVAAKHYVKKYSWMSMCFFKENNDNPQKIVWYGENDRAGIVYAHRDRMLDQMFTEMIEAKHLISVETNKQFKDFVKHFETMRRVKVINNKGIERFVWESTTGNDHYVFSHLYAYIAAQGGGNGEFYEQNPQSESVLKHDNVWDISRAFSQNNQNYHE